MKARFLIAMLRLVSRLPWPVLHGVGAVLGWLGWQALPKRRLVALTNLGACFPELTADQVKQLAAKNFRSTGIGLLESTVGYFGSRSKVLSRCSINGLQHIANARASGRGVLLLSGHATCIELVLRMVNENLDRPAWQLVRRHNNAMLEAAIDAGRVASSERTIEKKNLRAVLRALKQGHALFYGPDQNFTYHHVFAPFFNVPAASVTATADLVSRANAVLIPVWGLRDQKGRYHVTIEPAWDAFPQGDAVADASRVNRWLEDRVRENPEQYLWAHRRFRTRPQGEPPFYPDEALRKKHQR